MGGAALVEADQIPSNLDDVVVPEAYGLMDRNLIQPGSLRAADVFNKEVSVWLPGDADLLRRQIGVHRSEKGQRKMIGAAERGDGAAEDQLPTGTVAIEHRQPRFLQHHVRQPDTGPDRQTENHKRRRSTRHSTP